MKKEILAKNWIGHKTGLGLGQALYMWGKEGDNSSPLHEEECQERTQGSLYSELWVYVQHLVGFFAGNNLIGLMVLPCKWLGTMVKIQNMFLKNAVASLHSFLSHSQPKTLSNAK